MKAFGILSIIMFGVGWFAFGWLNYIGFALGIIGMLFSKQDKGALVLGIIGTVLCTIGGIIMAIYYTAM